LYWILKGLILFLQFIRQTCAFSFPERLRKRKSDPNNSITAFHMNSTLQTFGKRKETSKSGERGQEKVMGDSNMTKLHFIHV
jgi:hypothetical protein